MWELWNKEWLPSPHGNFLVLLVAIREGVHVGVVEQGVVAVPPRELLAPDSEVVIGNELGGGVGVLVSHAEGVPVPEDDDGDGGKEEALLPGLVAASMATAHLPGKGRSLGGDTKELLVGPCKGCHGEMRKAGVHLGVCGDT